MVRGLRLGIIALQLIQHAKHENPVFQSIFEEAQKMSQKLLRHLDLPDFLDKMLRKTGLRKCFR